MISFEYDGKQYELEANNRAIKAVENAGVRFSELGEKLSDIETLWKGLFVAHHSTVPDKKRMEIYNALAGSSVCDTLDAAADGETSNADEPADELMEAVFEEYTTAISNMKRAQGNIPWKRT